MPMPRLEAMSAIASLLLWANEKQITVSGVTPIVRPGHGIGVVAKRDLDVRK